VLPSLFRPVQLGVSFKMWKESLLSTFKYKDGKLYRKTDKEVGAFKGHIAYATFKFKSQIMYTHRAIWIMHHGKIPVGMVIDHINGDRSDNRIENLRVCTRAENNQNTRLRANNTSGTKGVWWDKHSKSWRVSIFKNKQKHDLGRFSSLEEARIIAATARNTIHGSFANHGATNAEAA